MRYGRWAAGSRTVRASDRAPSGCAAPSILVPRSGSARRAAAGGPPAQGPRGRGITTGLAARRQWDLVPPSGSARYAAAGGRRVATSLAGLCHWASFRRPIRPTAQWQAARRVGACAGTASRPHRPCSASGARATARPGRRAAAAGPPGRGLCGRRRPGAAHRVARPGMHDATPVPLRRQAGAGPLASFFDRRAARRGAAQRRSSATARRTGGGSAPSGRYVSGLSRPQSR